MGGTAGSRWAVGKRALHLVGALALAGGLAFSLAARSSSAPELALPFLSDGGEVAAESAYGELPLAFERGPERADFVARTASGTVLLSGDGATLAAGDAGAEPLRLALAGAAADVEPRAIARLPGEVNYLVGDDPSRWRTGVATFERVRYPHVYPGISVDWYGNQGRLEYDFRVAPGADPSRIAVEVGGADRLRLAANGDLVIDAGGSTLRQQAPIAYQTILGERRPVESSYAIRGRTVDFEVGAYDRSRPLVIDPLVLSYSTYLAGNDDDNAGDTGAIAVDGSGAAYVTGNTASTDYCVMAACSFETDDGGSDAFVSKLNPAGNALEYSTYLGGSLSDGGNGIAVDAAGGAWVVGTTSSDNFPMVNQIEGDDDVADIFISRLNPAGTALTYSTYLGGNMGDFGDAIAVDGAGLAYVTGRTDSDADFNLVGQIQMNQPGQDAFVSKIDPSQTTTATLIYSTYLGGDMSDAGNGIAVDSAGAAYVTGSTLSTNFCGATCSFEPDGGMRDAFITKLNPAGSAFSYSTYLGGDDNEQGDGIAVDAGGAAYITGDTDSDNLDIVGQIEGDDMDTDAFVSKLSPAGDALAYSTYLGGSSFDFGEAIAVDAAGAATMAGFTASDDFNLVDQLEGDSVGDDVIVSKLNPAGNALIFSTYLGGDSQDIARGVAVDSSGVAYMIGDTDSTDFDLLGQIEGDDVGKDVVVAKLGEPVIPPAGDAADTDPPETLITKGPKRKTKRRNASFGFISTEPGSSFECSLDGKATFKPCASPLELRVKRGKHSFQVQATDPAGNVDATPATDDWKVKKKRKKK
jgi:Beta-propeller repeat